MSGESAHWLGLDVGGSKLLAVRVDAGQRVVASARRPTLRDEGPDAVVRRCVELCRELRDGTPVAGLGVGFAGLVDTTAGVVRSSIMLPGWTGVALAARLRAALEVPVVVDNDANVAGFGELIALGRPRDLHMIVLTVGTGIGGAVVIGGEIYRGAGGLAGEFGNSTLDWRGVACWCGSRGCANMLASGSALVRWATELGVMAPDGVVLTAEVVVARARAGDLLARQATTHAAHALGALIANAINVFNPHRVAIAGGLSALDDEFFADVRAEAGRRAFAEAFAQARIERARLGADTGAVGAAVWARECLGPRSTR